MAARLGVRKRVSDQAVDAAFAAQREFQDRLLAAGARALHALAETGAPGLVLHGRPYNV
jgi:predicted nucleotide-binding protein (sugar kinase/HSP70/actin superfamily)